MVKPLALEIHSVTNLFYHSEVSTRFVSIANSIALTTVASRDPFSIYLVQRIIACPVCLCLFLEYPTPSPLVSRNKKACFVFYGKKYPKTTTPPRFLMGHFFFQPLNVLNPLKGSPQGEHQAPLDAHLALARLVRRRDRFSEGSHHHPEIGYNHAAVGTRRVSSSSSLSL